jgi:hypothetical protein
MRSRTRTVIAMPARERRPRGKEFGPGALEMRAMGGYSGLTILERIVMKKLFQLYGEGGFIVQEPFFGGRQLYGGLVTDFIITAVYPPCALEIQGAYWHSNPMGEARDAMRKAMIESLGYRYVELEEWEITLGDKYLESKIEELVGT